MKRRILLLFNLFWLIILSDSCSVSQKNCTRLLQESMTKTYDIIIVPGFPFEYPKWGWEIKGRVYWSKYLFDKGIAKNIIYSGAAVYSPYSEAEIMALYAEAIGIPKEHIFIETKAKHSSENVYYSYKKARKIGFSKIALASDPVQVKMVRKFLHSRVSPDIDIIPFVIDTLKMLEPTMSDPEIDYNKVFIKDFIALPQRENIWKRLRGSRGNEIDTTAYN
jgi:uncharacterized SAM-binding protein YcdF (DUF218 family)